MHQTNFFNFYKGILVKTEHMTNNDFEQMAIHESNQISNFFYITAQGKQENRILLNLSYFEPKLKQDQSRIITRKLIECGTIINVIYKNNSSIKSQFDKWIKENMSKGFLEQIKFSSLLPFLFADFNPNDSLFYQGTINPNVIKIFSKILSKGYIFLNEPDIKKGKVNYNFASNNICVLCYKEPSEVPQIQLFDKVICIAPSSEDGFLYNISNKWSVESAIKKHSIQKEYLRNSLKMLKIDGICVYATYSINPIENEAVVNEVLDELKNDFCLVDCTNKFDDIKPFQGLTEWKIEGFDCKKKNVSNINFCMRFYSYLIHSDSTFVAVIKRVNMREDDESFVKTKNEKNIFTKVPQNIIVNIINEFGFRICNFTNLWFFYSDMFEGTIFNVSKQLGKVIEGANMPLKICHLGSSSFFFDDNNFKSIPIPYYDNLPHAAKYPSKRLISIDFNNFEKLVKELSISIEEFSDQNAKYLKSIEQGGIFIRIESSDFIFGAYLHCNFVKLKMSSEKAINMLERANDLILFQTVGIGESDFYNIRKKNNLYVDKTEFLRLWWKEGQSVTLITRPRRFGKSLTLSMVKCFFSTEYAKEKENLFKGTNVWEDDEMMENQGTYPVISMSFGKDKSSSVDIIIKTIKFEISNAFKALDKELFENANKLNESEVKLIGSIVNNEMDDETAFKAIYNLCSFIYKIYNKKVIILLDEYDSPMIKFWRDQDETGLKRMTSFLTSFFCSTFKENPFLERAIITGITHICNESIFSGFNNLQVINSTSWQYSQIFGFTYNEVKEILIKYGLIFWKDEVVKWYDGYCFGMSFNIFNPWSITKFVHELEVPNCYWLNTSDNSLVEYLIRKSSPTLSSFLTDLLQNNELTISIQEDISFKDIYIKKLGSIFSLLVASGYMTINGKIEENRNILYKLKIPNFEIQQVFKRIIESWFSSSFESYSDFIHDFLQCNLDSLNQNLNKIIFDCIGTFDSVECFFHCLCLSMFIELRDRFEVLSNRRREKGRPDIIFIPKDSVNDNRGYIMQFKYQSKPQNNKKKVETVLQTLAEEALKQIDYKKYINSIASRGVDPSNIIKYAIVFYDFECLITT